MFPFTVRKVRLEQEAFDGAAAGGRYIAGGTTLVDLMREEVERPRALVDISALPFDHIRDSGGGLVLGALARMADVAADADVSRTHPLLVETLIEGASPQIRNMATIGGNLLQRNRCPYFRQVDAACNKRSPGSGCAAIDGVNGGHAIFGTSSRCVATHPSDLAVSLVAMGSSLRLRGPSGERRLPVEHLFRLPEETPHLEHNLMPGELIVEVFVPHTATARQARYLKVRDRSSYEYALVSVAAAIQVQDGRIAKANVAAGGVGTVPWRLRAVEEALVGRRAGRTAYEAVAHLAVSGARPLKDNGYKVALLRRTVTRALEMAGEA